MTIKGKIIDLLKYSEKYTKTDMSYAIKGGFWFVAGKAGVFLVSLFTMIAFARWLPREEYGTYQFILSGLAIFSIFTLSGINATIIKSISQGKEGTLQLAKKEKVKWGKIGAVLSLGLAGWYLFQGNYLLSGAFLIGALFIPFKETFHIFSYFWVGRKKFDTQAKYEMTSMGLSAILLILAIYLTDNVLVIVFLFLASHTFFDWLLYRKTERKIINNEQDPEAISFGKNLTLITLLLTVNIYVDRIIIWHFLGAVPLAIYTFALLPIQKIQVMMPITPLALAKLGENKIDEQRKKGVISKFLRLFFISIPLSIILIFTAPYLYQLFFPQYLESIIFFQALSLLIAFSPFLLLNAALISEMKKKALYITNIGAPLLKIILFFILIPYFGIWGIITAILIAELSQGILALYFFLKI